MTMKEDPPRDAYRIAEISGDQLEALHRAEHRLRDETQKALVLIAYEPAQPPAE